MSRNILAAIMLLGVWAIPGATADPTDLVPDACESLPIVTEPCREAIQNWIEEFCVNAHQDCWVCLEFNPGRIQISPSDVIPVLDVERRVISAWWVGVGPSDGSIGSPSRMVAGTYLLSAGLDDFDGCNKIQG